MMGLQVTSIIQGGLQILYSLLVVWILGKLVPALFNYLKWRKSINDCPGEKEFSWLTGNTHKVPADTEDRLEYHQKNMVKYSKVYRLWHGPLFAHVLVHHPETVRDILKSSEPKPRGLGGVYEYAVPWLGEGLLISNGEKWARSRRLLTPGFHFDILKPYVKIYNNAAELLMVKMDGHMKSGESFELFSNVSLCTLDIILRCAFSYESNCQQKGETHPYVLAVNELAQLWLQRSRSPWFHLDILYHMTSEGTAFRKHCDYVHTVTEEIIASRRMALEKCGKPQSCYLDFLDILLAARDENGNGLSNLEIRNEADTFLFEGHDTTASGISWILYSLAQHQHYQIQVQKEIDGILQGRKSETLEWEDIPKLTFLTQCIKEGLRLHTPVPFIQRLATKGITLDGHRLPKKTRITIHLYNLHHNPHVWVDPMMYKPDRFAQNNARNIDSYAFVPFSAGPRNCIGQHFAMNEEKIVIARILQRFCIELDPNHVVRKRLSAVMRAENGIKIRIFPRKHT